MSNEILLCSMGNMSSHLWWSMRMWEKKCMHVYVTVSPCCTVEKNLYCGNNIYQKKKERKKKLKKNRMHFKCSLLPSAPSRKAAWLPTLATNMKHLHLTCGLHIWPFFPISVHLSQHNRSGYQKLFFACFSWLRNISKSSTTSLLCLFLLLNAASISIMPSHFALIRCFQETSFLLPSACLLTSLFIY